MQQGMIERFLAGKSPDELRALLTDALPKLLDDQLRAVMETVVTELNRRWPPGDKG